VRRFFILLLAACAAAAGATLTGDSVADAAQTTAVETPLTQMADTERAFAARAAEVGWKQAFLEYFAPDAVGFENGAAGLARDQVAAQPDPPKGHSLVWEPRYGDIAGSGELGYLTGPSTSQSPGRAARHQVYASVWKKQRDGTYKVVLDVGVVTPRAAAFAPGLVRAPNPNRFSGDYDDRTPPLAAADGVLNAALRLGQAGGYRGRLTPEARLHRPGAMPLVGPTRIQEWLATQPALTLGDTRYSESARSGDLGYTWGTYQIVRGPARAGGPRRVEEGFYARVWTRERTGQWQVALDVLQPQEVVKPRPSTTARQ
jgi:ketosteroid isomerase-like protein